MRRTVGAPRKVDGGGQDESEKACKSWQTNVDIVRNVQSLGIRLFGYPVIRVNLL
jgi:hypothetical protein